MKRIGWKKILLLVLAVLLLAAAALYFMVTSNEQWSPVPPVVAPRDTDGTPPKGALILFDGMDLSQWQAQSGGPAGWKVADGVVKVDKSAGSIVTRRSFRNFQLHIEWRVPTDIDGSGQLRGNSGVFLASLGSGDEGYEVQILDSWHNPTYVNGQAGAVYKQHAPLANPIRPPGQWNVYDITWTAPVFTKDGKLQRPARVSVLFNGTLVQDNFALKGQTKFIGRPAYTPHGAAPVMLQAHGDRSKPISFRNIWLRELP